MHLGNSEKKRLKTFYNSERQSDNLASFEIAV